MLDSGREVEERATPNLSEPVLAYLRSFDLDASDQVTGEVVWLHALSVGYSNTYLRENADGIRDGWPRLPLPSSKGKLLASAELGRKVASLLDMDEPVPKVTHDPLGVGFRLIGPVTKIGEGQLDPAQGDLKMTAGWGHGTDVVMPGAGRVIEREYSTEELEGFRKEGDSVGLSQEEVLTLLGDKTLDVYLSDVAYWSNVPVFVWDYVIGGYQVFKKWLSYRDYQVLGRSLTIDEVRQGTAIVRRLAGLLLMQPAIDDNYNTIKDNAFNLTSLST
jgi:hypothetical protein